MMPTKSILVDQCLHGYDDGHRLLASSCKLSRDAERAMIALTDLSGSSSGSIFAPYLTGYPLDEDQYYALSLTWPATEMSRPGCVWSHTILFPMDQIAGLETIHAIFPQFVRPTDPSEFSAFRLKTEFRFTNFKHVDGENWEAVAALEGLMRYPQAKVACSVESHEKGIEIVDEVWHFIWPKARERFSFCTYIKAPQLLKGSPLDLQVFLERERSSVMRRVQAKGIHVISPPYPVVSYPALIEIRNREPNTAFPGSLSGMSLLYKLVSRLASATAGTAKEVIDFLADEFPKPTEGIELKSALLGASNMLHLSNAEIIAELIRSQRASSFDIAIARICDPISQLWDNIPDAIAVARIAMDNSEEKIAQQVIEQLAAGLPKELIRDVVSSDIQVFEKLLETNPELWECEEIWQVGNDYIPSIIAMLKGNRTSIASKQKQIVLNAVKVGLSEGWNDLLDNLGHNSLLTSLEAWEGKGTHQFPASYNVALMKHDRSVTDWLNSRATLCMATTCAFLHAMNSRSLNDLGDVFSALSQFIVKSRSEVIVNQELTILAFALGLRFDEVTVVVALLPHVHQAVAAGKISKLDWDRLVQVLPPLDFWSSWDKCKQIRSAVAERYVYHNWLFSSFEMLNGDVSLQLGILREMKRLPGGKNLANEFKKKLSIEQALDSPVSDEEDFID